MFSDLQQKNHKSEKKKKVFDNHMLILLFSRILPGLMKRKTAQEA